MQHPAAAAQSEGYLGGTHGLAFPRASRCPGSIFRRSCWCPSLLPRTGSLGPALLGKDTEMSNARSDGETPRLQRAEPSTPPVFSINILKSPLFYTHTGKSEHMFQYYTEFSVYSEAPLPSQPAAEGQHPACCPNRSQAESGG